jgi:hypothetical protein
MTADQIIIPRFDVSPLNAYIYANIDPWKTKGTIIRTVREVLVKKS